MLGFLFKLIDPIGSIAGKIADAYAARQKAATDTERIRADAEIKTLEARRDVLVAEAPSRINAFVRAALTFPVVILAAKILVWDKAFGQWTGGRTDALSPEIIQYCGAVVGFYFVTEAITKTASIIKRR